MEKSGFRRMELLKFSIIGSDRKNLSEIGGVKQEMAGANWFGMGGLMVFHQLLLFTRSIPQQRPQKKPDPWYQTTRKTRPLKKLNPIIGHLGNTKPKILSKCQTKSRLDFSWINLPQLIYHHHRSEIYQHECKLSATSGLQGKCVAIFLSW